VLTALLCAYSFIPTFTSFFKSKKLLAFTLSTYLSICLLLFTCAVYTDGLSWFLTSCVGVLIGYELLLVPIFLSRTSASHYKFVISFAVAWALTLLLLLNINLWHPIKLNSAILVASYAFIPCIISTVICTFPRDAFLKTGACVAFSTVVLYFTEYVVDILFGTDESNYQVNFHDWEQCLEGNVQLICLASLLFISVVFVCVGFFRIRKNKIR
jgi:hypothetical protein